LEGPFFRKTEESDYLSPTPYHLTPTWFFQVCRTNRVQGYEARTPGSDRSGWLKNGVENPAINEVTC
jgi:hypothetical protein